MGVVYYEVSGDGEPYEVRVRHEASDYERSISTYKNEADWQCEVVAMIGLVCANRYKAEISAEMIDAFNAWRQAEYAKNRRWTREYIAISRVFLSRNRPAISG